MRTYLVFRLYGPMASWGQASVGGDRPTGGQPTRSALLGLIAAACGIRRENHEALQALGEGLKFAVKQISAGTLMRDYHTVQAPSQRRGTVAGTRARELREPRINTILSNRDYRCDGLWVVAAEAGGPAAIDLNNVRDRLSKPIFSLYLGRKSCPMSAPLQAQIIDARDAKEALDSVEFPSLTRSAKEDRFWLGAGQSITYFWEGDVTDFPGVSGGRYTTRPWDDPIDRRRWQFGQRELHQLTVEEAL